MKKIILAGVVLVSGCATTPEYYWYRDGASNQQFNMDSGQCRAQAFSVAGASMFQAVMVMESCLQGKGWEKRGR